MYRGLYEHFHLFQGVQAKIKNVRFGSLADCAVS